MSDLIKKIEAHEVMYEEDIGTGAEKEKRLKEAKDAVGKKTVDELKAFKEKIASYEKKLPGIVLDNKEDEKGTKRTEVGLALHELSSHVETVQQVKASASAESKGTLDTITDKIEEMTKKFGDFLAPFIEKAQNFFGGSVGKLWTMLGLTIPAWATPDAIELRGLKAIFRETEFQDLSFEKNPDVNADRTNMRALKEIFLKADKSKMPANSMQDFLREALRETRTFKGTDKSFTLEDIVDAARRAFPEKKEEPKKTEDKDKKVDEKDKKPEEKPKEGNK